MLKKISLILLVCAGISSQAQELNCQVQVLTQQVPGSNKQVFQTLQSAIYEFMNNTRWTSDVFAIEERIECSMVINITKVISQDDFEATIQVQSSRPVFNSSYNTPILNVFDGNFNFRYLEFSALEFNENAHLSNLTSVLAFYAYTIIGLDYDTYSMKGGQEYHLKAQKIVNNAQNDNSAFGWKAFEGNQNRYWLNENLLSQTFAPLRECLYTYHRKGLDVMHSQVEAGRTEISNALQKLKAVHNKQPSSFLMQLFFQAKADEIVNIFKPELPVNKATLVTTLKLIDPGNINKYEAMMRQN